MNRVKLAKQGQTYNSFSRFQNNIFKFRKKSENPIMTSMLFKIKCEKGHKANALIWEGQTIQNYIAGKKCNSCGSTLHQLSK